MKETKSNTNRYFIRKDFSNTIKECHPDLFHAVDLQEGEAYSRARNIKCIEYVRFNDKKDKYMPVSKGVFVSIIKEWGYLGEYNIGDFVTAASWPMSGKTGRLTYIDENGKCYIERNDGSVITSKRDHLVSAMGIDLAFAKAKDGKIVSSINFSNESVKDKTEYKDFDKVTTNDQIRVLDKYLDQMRSR